MGDKKRTHCKTGLHELVPGNLYHNAEGFRECKQCKLRRQRDARRKARHGGL
jgi:hypothetical protein